MSNGHVDTMRGFPMVGEMVAAPPAKQAYQLLHIAFVAAPIIAGLDKFFHVLVNWDQYLAPWIATLSPIGGHNLMLLVGIVEIIAGLIVAFRPKIGAWIVFAWMWAIIINLLTYPGYYDIALRDFGLSLGALALARLSQDFGS
jgi:hypothetical protein